MPGLRSGIRVAEPAATPLSAADVGRRAASRLCLAESPIRVSGSWPESAR